MRKAFLAGFVLATTLSFAQKKKGIDISEIIRPEEIEAHLSFLAADEMRGRNAGSPEIEIAANYIRSNFKREGLKTVPGAEQYFQKVDQIKLSAPTYGKALIGDKQFNLKENLLIIDGDTTSWSGEFIYVGYGAEEDLKKNDIKGKMVLALAGSKDADMLNKVMMASSQKVKNVRDAGGIGLVEFLVFPQAPWPTLVNYLTQPTWNITRPGKVIPHVFLKPADLASLSLQEGQTIKGSLTISGKKRISVPGKNVVGLIEGTDAKLKDQFVVVTAHYDHIGVGKSKDGEDSIFNGARDNAIGATALMQTAKYLKLNPPKRSVLLVALTSEEKGLLGSKWYTENPLIPLNKTVLSINCDGVGYNDKTILTSISWGRTSSDPIVTKAAKSFGLGVGGDPDPKEGFFERSDQVSFASKGVVAIKLQPGLARMDDEIRKYYHRQADEVSSLDFEYLTKFYKTFVTAVQLLSNEPQKFTWNAGDKYEEVSRKLYAGETR
jgi:hypothetical protein